MGMEVNRQEYNQRRTSMVRFLGELYNYRLVDSSLVFKVLYSLITFGVVQLDQEEPADSLDPPEHMLRHAVHPAHWKFFLNSIVAVRIA
jgi:regulator of nonsense transcripts 2